MKPDCPFCGKFLELKTYNYSGTKDELGIIRYLRGDFNICGPCRKHWPRSALISVHTAREGRKPKERA